MDTPILSAVSLDQRPEVVGLFASLQGALPELSRLLAECTGCWVYEDGLYRYYHQSFKVFALQALTQNIAIRLQRLAPQRPLHPLFLALVHKGTGNTFEPAHHAQWADVAGPVVEAFLHAKYFLEMVVKYGQSLEGPPAQLMPGGWAAILQLYGLR
ncbi:MAG: hypothetical protein IT464_01810 [Planctomycetes bacterium]|nr:hypothetical protein [Planctomycetota bacterium]